MKSNTTTKHVAAPAVKVTQEIESKFWSKVIKGQPDECWLFNSKMRSYPRIYLSRSKYIKASRIALAINNQGYLESGVFACHHCDNPQCVNPLHIFAGSPKTNMDDKCQKGRQTKGWDVIKNKHIPKGEEVKTSKLTQFQVQEIKRLAPKGVAAQKEVASKYGVSDRMIRYILKAAWWKSAAA